MLDPIDRAIVTLLQEDGRATNREIAAVAGVAPSTAIERVRSLHARGIITGYSATVALAAVGRPVQALIAVTIRPPSRVNIETFRDWVPQLPETVGVFVTSGTQDFLLHIAVPDTDSLYAFVIDRLTERPEVADVNTSIVYAHLPSAAVDADSPRRPRPSRRP
ncbi:Lrp/AsnC family transcriptional regulator [Pengzhenrongella sp.]|uniref:Lrp/AsnC family transcriptional regulator n=1 Tax=Pengzhenrongella sp. TaxID=2888820 RepID=UPI002F92F62B